MELRYPLPVPTIVNDERSIGSSGAANPGLEDALLPLDFQIRLFVSDRRLRDVRLALCFGYGVRLRRIRDTLD